MTQEDQALVAGEIQIQTGGCNQDGKIIQNGLVYWLGVPVGTDVTGISNAVSPNGPICHNTAVWQAAANYMCNMNQGALATSLSPSSTSTSTVRWYSTPPPKGTTGSTSLMWT